MAKQDQEETCRALASLATQGERPAGARTLKRLRELCPPNRDPTQTCDPPPTDKDVVAYAAGQEAAKALHSPSKLSAPGLTGGRAEHWQASALDSGSAENLARLLGRIVIGQVPDEVARTLRACEVSALPKGDTDI